ncbi:hypothetical protein LHYA1_G003553 [Lachnellula hyalina]|uniref:Uncharacterized protein n=1 Tax=Lachnellula hyalina TaxID=1316788 RepID=A0A8H8R2B3_9HELO|nr:uncharacterized protein LHYA1_G003553 [Lachnellula hyalina]TVY26465.1 hypothetical protein LHYA1_G003553 [Lachnellula hyalina]
MFAGIGAIAALKTPTPRDGPRTIPPQTPVGFPQCTPQAGDQLPFSSGTGTPLVALLQKIHRPADIKLAHFEALGLHVIPDSSPEDIIPEAGFLPPVEEWNAISTDNLQEANNASKKLLNNGNLSPGAQTYRERQNELLIDNTAAFRTVRRISPPSGEAAVRLGNAYEFFKNLEFFTGYWDDTSLPPKPESTSDAVEDQVPRHLKTHQRTGSGAQLPPDYRQHLLTAFIKLISYDFGCNVSFPRTEPRLHINPPPTSSSPPTYFNSSATFVYRTPTDRAAARSGIIEGPVAAVSCRNSTVFATEAESQLDLAREVIAVLLTAQQRAREGKTEKRFGEGKWWTTKPRWGGGPGGAMGKEADKVDDLGAVVGGTVPEKIVGEEKGVAAEAKRAIGGINGPSPNKRSKKGKEGINFQIYDSYRKMLPPSSTWDRKARYSSIGKAVGQGYDDIFLVSSLNHHVSIVRVRVPDKLLSTLDGNEQEDWGRMNMWRSKWYDLFIAKERVDAMQVVWGMIAYLMRKVEDPSTEVDQKDTEGAKSKSEKMDLS